MSGESKIYAPIGNYYGTPYVERSGQVFIMSFEDWSGEESVKVSKAFYEAWKAEFETNKERSSTDEKV